MNTWLPSLLLFGFEEKAITQGRVQWAYRFGSLRKFPVRTTIWCRNLFRVWEHLHRSRFVCGCFWCIGKAPCGNLSRRGLVLSYCRRCAPAKETVFTE